MGRYKCAYNCESDNESDVTFFKFPLYNERKLKKWLVNMKWKDWSPSRFSVLCSNHFEEQYIDRSGRSLQLRDNAVPSIFSSPEHMQKKKKTAINPRSKRYKSHRGKASQTSSADQTPATNTTAAEKPVDAQIQETNHAEEESAGEAKSPGRWRIIIDEGLTKIESFPSFFHGDYCLPQVVQWAPDDNLSTESPDPENVIQVAEPWQWLGLDVRGPLPQTANGHKYILTLTDYYSKWVEAVPLQSCLASHVATQIIDIVAHFGFPLRILSRLPHEIVHKINRELKDQLKISLALLVHHRQTGTADLTTQQLIDRMVNDLIEQHAADWDVYLPAKVFSLCFKEHSKTKERPFSLLCCKGTEPVQSPRGLHFTSSKIQESAFVVR
ncbi:uncharacterized protein LOC142992296 [Genypterus blacodes]|uniref:uncharacterized protein LOC142992296 n=1 Tax=Genypterus blacodes TaxID=154954 RepID=UPI003F76777C